MRRTIRLRTITYDDFDMYFDIDGPGGYLARHAAAAGELDSPIDQLEAVCLLNERYAANMARRISGELAPFGEDIVGNVFSLDSDEGMSFLTSIMGEERLIEIASEVLMQTREEWTRQFWLSGREGADATRRKKRAPKRQS